MKNAVKTSSVIACSAVALFGATSFAAAFSPLDEARLAATRADQSVNRTVKSDRLANSGKASTVSRSGKANALLNTVALPDVSRETSTLPRRTGATRSATDDVTAGTRPGKSQPAAQVVAPTDAVANNDETKISVQPAARTNETTTNVNLEPERPEPASRAIWLHSKGTIERAQRRARFLWNVLTSNK